MSTVTATMSHQTLFYSSRSSNFGNVTLSEYVQPCRFETAALVTSGTRKYVCRRQVKSNASVPASLAQTIDTLVDHKQQDNYNWQQTYLLTKFKRDRKVHLHNKYKRNFQRKSKKLLSTIFSTFTVLVRHQERLVRYLH